MKIKGRVTQNDIKKGKRKDFNKCPLALNIAKKALSIAQNNSFVEISVDSFTIHIKANNQTFYCTVPDDISEKIRDYDQYGRMKPFDYELDFDKIS